MRVLRESNLNDFKIEDGVLRGYVGPGGNVTIPNNVKSIGSDAFFGCTGLTSITIPDSVTSIGDDAFYNCKGLTNIVIPNSVTSIGEKVFWNCVTLESITIPNSVKIIGKNTLALCHSLKFVFTQNKLVIDQWMREGISRGRIKSSIYDLYDTDED